MKSIDENYGAKNEQLVVDSTSDRIYKSTPGRISFEHFQMCSLSQPRQPRAHLYKTLCLLFLRWTGANTNPRNIAGQGAAGTDRSNVALLQSQRYPEGDPNAITPKKVGQFGVNYPAHLDTCMVTSLNFDRRFQ